MAYICAENFRASFNDDSGVHRRELTVKLHPRQRLLRIECHFQRVAICSDQKSRHNK